MDATRPVRIYRYNSDTDSDLLTSDPTCAEMESCSHLDASRKCVVYTGRGTVHYGRGNFIIEGKKKSKDEMINCTVTFELHRY